VRQLLIACDKWLSHVANPYRTRQFLIARGKFLSHVAMSGCMGLVTSGAIRWHANTRLNRMRRGPAQSGKVGSRMNDRVLAMIAYWQ
jgi:hypothetical protein